MDFSLTQSYYSLSDNDKKRYLSIKDTIPLEERRFFEGSVFIPGQMWAAERKFLYTLIKQHKPLVTVEIGTCKGGGSTYFIANALMENKHGILHTFEIDIDFYDASIEGYKSHAKELMPYIEFIHGDIESWQNIPQEINFVFLDGGDNPEKTVLEFNFLAPYLHKGSIIAAHDWNTEKMVAFKPMIEALSEWVVIDKLSLPVSLVGMAAFIHK